jgi:hypothetical protein
MRVGEGRVGIEKAGMAGARYAACNEMRTRNVIGPCTVLACAT